MQRRAFIAALGAGLLAVSLAAEAQQARKQSHVGLLSLGAMPTGAAAAGLAALEQGLRDLGYIEGQNLRLEYRFADGKRDQLLLFARELAALAHPGGNLTGFSFVGEELAAKNLELLQQAVPHVSRVAVLAAGYPTQPFARNINAALERSAHLLGITLQRLQVEGSVEQLESALITLAAKRPDALLTLNDPLFFLHRGRILDSAIQLRLPTMFQNQDYVREGGLMAYVPNLLDQSRRAAVYVDKVLKGAKPADLPVEQPTKFQFVINLKTAKALGLTIPPSLLARADEVIE